MAGSGREHSSVRPKTRQYFCLRSKVWYITIFTEIRIFEKSIQIREILQQIADYQLNRKVGKFAPDSMFLLSLILHLFRTPRTQGRIQSLSLGGGAEPMLSAPPPPHPLFLPSFPPVPSRPSLPYPSPPSFPSLSPALPSPSLPLKRGVQGSSPRKF